MASFECPPQMEVPKEIERKFLVLRLPDELESYTHNEIKQGYLVVSDDTEVRLRQKDENYYQTVKSGAGEVRTEVEIPFSQEQFEKLWILTEGKRVEKTRYKVPLDEDLIAELDLYHGDLEGLQTVEVEFISEAQSGSFTPPEWFGNDVTKDKRYKNQQLATQGLPEADTMETDSMPAMISEPIGETPERSERPDLPEFGLEDGVDELTRRIAEIKDSKLESVVILVAGGSASGKTSHVAGPLVDRLGDEAVLVSMDNYYRGKTFMKRHEQETGETLNWDQPEAVDLELFAEHLHQLKHGNSIEMPKYDMKIGERVPTWSAETGESIPDSTIHVDSRKVIVVEGLFALNDTVVDEGDIKAFVEVSTHGRVMRRLMRDTGGRTTQTPSQVLAYFAEVVEPMSQKYIDSTEQNADIIITNEYDPTSEAKGIHEVQLKFPGTLDEGRLRGLGAERLATLLQRDDYYQPRNREGKPTDELVRMREENGHIIMTYKGPKVAAEYRERPKIEFEITEEIKENFERMYGKPSKTVNKSREMYQLDGVVFTLDSVQKNEDGQATDLGQFVEIRTVNDESSIRRFIDLVGLDPSKAEKRSYADM